MTDTARSLRLLMASPWTEDEARRKDDAERFLAMAGILSDVGLRTRYVQAGGDRRLRTEIGAFAPDLAFCSFFRPSGDEVLTMDLERLLFEEGAAWVGSSRDTLELALSKPRTKEVWRAAGVPTPDWITVNKASDGSMLGIERLETLRDFPYIIKPACEGNSRGIDADSVVSTPIGLLRRTTAVAETWGEALVERFVGGHDDSREFTVAMIGNGKKAIVAAVEIVKPEGGGQVVTERYKDSHATRTRPIEDVRLKERVERLARRAFESTGVRDYSRCDILLDRGELYAIEINGQPMVPDLWFEACAREAGLDGRQYPVAIILAGLTRNIAEGRLFAGIPSPMSSYLPPGVRSRLMP